ncbi:MULTISPECIES: hypothetical protein [unclassified Mesorhizobium]|nr:MULTISPECIES: hypothetical protein [unclassified Mesorhizobium]
MVLADGAANEPLALAALQPPAAMAAIELADGRRVLHRWGRLRLR